MSFNNAPGEGCFAHSSHLEFPCAFVSIWCVAADERGCDQRYPSPRLDGGTSEVGYEVGPDRVFVSCETDSSTCEARALQRCTR